MRENRPYGSEGGATELNRSSLPLSDCRPLRALRRPEKNPRPRRAPNRPRPPGPKWSTAAASCTLPWTIAATGCAAGRRILAVRDELSHLDTLDLCQVKSRQSFIRAAASELYVEEPVIKRERGMNSRPSGFPAVQPSPT